MDVWPEPLMKKLEKAGALTDFCLTVHYRLCFNSGSVHGCTSLQETLKDYGIAVTLLQRMPNSKINSAWGFFQKLEETEVSNSIH